MNSNHIFVVGCPRSGTTLLWETLKSNPDIALAPETHFFSSLIHKGVLKSVKKLLPFDTDEKLTQLTNLFKSGKIFGMIWIDWERKINFNETIAEFAKTKRTPKDLFEQIMFGYARFHGKTRGGDKTPSHLYHVDTMVDWYPDCRVIHILRDPRALLLSEMYKDAKPDYFLGKDSPFYDLGLFFWVLMGWWLALNRHDKYSKLYPNNYMMVRFEDLVVNPGEKVKELCDFLDIELTDEMRELPVVNSSFEVNSTHRPLTSWKEKLPKKYKFLLTALLRQKLKKYGYLQ